MTTSRNKQSTQLSKDEEQVLQRFRSMVVRELLQWCSKSDLQSIKLTPKEDLHWLHTALSASIRNEYELWLPEHEVTQIWLNSTKNDTVCDEHPCHPNVFSFSCVELLWENLQ